MTKTYNSMENMLKATTAQSTKKEATAKEKERRIGLRKTQGAKGCRMPRINLGYTMDNYNFIRVVSRMQGKTMSRLINDIIEKYRKEHQHLYDKAKELAKEFENEE